MKHMIGAFGTLIILVINILICIAVITVSGYVAEAKEYKAAVVAEIENSNFNPNVIDSCIRQAGERGYHLQVQSSIYDADYDIRTAEVILSYTYRMPLFGIEETKTTRGIAR